MSSLYVTGVVEYRKTVFEFHGHQQSLQNEKKKKESQGFESFVFSSFTYRHRSVPLFVSKYPLRRLPPRPNAKNRWMEELELEMTAGPKSIPRIKC